MRQLSCKRIFILFINFCFFIALASAQDSTKTSSGKTTQASQKKTTPSVKPVYKPTKQLSTKNPSTSQSQPAVSEQVQAKVASTPVRIDHSLNGQYQDLLKYSWMQKGYKVIQPFRLTALWKSVSDTLSRNKRELFEAKQKIDAQARQISKIKEQNLANPGSPVIAPSESAPSITKIEILGMSIDTSTYNWVVWGTIFVLALGLTGVLFSTTKNSMEAKHHRQLYQEISEEYQSFKAKSKEKELKLARELQTERNTIEELMAKNSDTEPAKKGKK